LFIIIIIIHYSFCFFSPNVFSTAQILQQLFDGSLKVNVPVIGQSLEDEKTEVYLFLFVFFLKHTMEKT